jgi:riboflavin-specific deaminase-like protein
VTPRTRGDAREDPYAGIVLPSGRRGADWWVAVSMVASVDGAATISGRSRGLGGEADSRALGRLREAADVVVVGAETVRAEDYGPLVATLDVQQRRRAAGLTPTPRLALVTASGDLSRTARVFASPDHRPLVLTSEVAEPATSRAVGDVANVLVCGREMVDFPRVLQTLADLGLRRVLAEGGPSINAQLIEQDLIDELFITLDARLVGGVAPRIAQGVEAPAPRPLKLVGATPAGDDLLLRYRRWRDGEPGTEPPLRPTSESQPAGRLGEG